MSYGGGGDHGDETFFLTLGLNVTVPTGDEERELGEGHTSLEPMILVYWDLGHQTVFQGQFSLELPIGAKARREVEEGEEGPVVIEEEKAEEVFLYNLALAHTFVETSVGPSSAT